MGELIVIEGACDGIGKTTQYKRLIEHLKKDNMKVFSHHFPSYNTYQGVSIEKYLSGEYGNIDSLSPYFINNLYASDRAITWYTYLKEKCETNDILLLDRYTTSSIIYQSALIENLDEKKKFIDWIIDFEYNKLGIKKPDKIIFLYASFDLVTKMRDDRKNNDGLENDIHERNIEFMKKVYDNAMFVADYLSWEKIKCDDGLKMRSIDDIHNEIYKVIK